MAKWINTERASIERAKELLAEALPGVPIWIRWYRLDRAGKGGGWEPIGYFSTVELVGTTAKRLKVKDGRAVYYADPNRCFFAYRQER